MVTKHCFYCALQLLGKLLENYVFILHFCTLRVDLGADLGAEMLWMTNVKIKDTPAFQIQATTCS